MYTVRFTSKYNIFPDQKKLRGHSSVLLFVSSNCSERGENVGLSVVGFGFGFKSWLSTSLKQSSFMLLLSKEANMTLHQNTTDISLTSEESCRKPL